MLARYEYQKQDAFYEAELHVMRLGDLAIATNPGGMLAALTTNTAESFLFHWRQTQ